MSKRIVVLIAVSVLLSIPAAASADGLVFTVKPNLQMQSAQLGVAAGRFTPYVGLDFASIGAKLLSGSDSAILQMSEVVALTHHEKWDGTGYPQGLKGEEIPIEGRVVALADVFDALCSKRCYKPAFPFEKSLSIIKEGCGKHFCPAVVDAFLEGLVKVRNIHRRYSD